MQEKLRSYTELPTKLLLSNSGAWLGERFKLLHVLRKQLLTPNDTTPNGKHKFGKSSPAGKASTQTISHQKLTQIPGHGSSIQALNSSGWIWGCKASKLRWGDETIEAWLLPRTHTALFFVAGAPKEGLQRSQRTLPAKVVCYSSRY